MWRTSDGYCIADVSGRGMGVRPMIFFNDNQRVASAQEAAVSVCLVIIHYISLVCHMKKSISVVAQVKCRGKVAVKMTRKAYIAIQYRLGLAVLCKQDEDGTTLIYPVCNMRGNPQPSKPPAAIFINNFLPVR